jgi:hypothetical protein
MSLSHALGHAKMEGVLWTDASKTSSEISADFPQGAPSGRLLKSSIFFLPHQASLSSGAKCNPRRH